MFVKENLEENVLTFPLLLFVVLWEGLSKVRSENHIV